MGLNNKKVVRSVEVIFGLILILFGLNGFFQFMGLPEFNEAGGAYIGALFATRYIFPILGLVMLLSGIIFLVGRYVAFGSLILLPMSFNFILFHVFLDWNGWIGAFVVFILNIYLIWTRWDRFKILFR
jgi:putative oxidoreductase